MAFSLVLLAFGLVAFREAYLISGFSGLTTGGAIPMTAAGILILSGLVIVRDAAARRTGARVSLAETARFLFPPRLILFVALLVLYAAAIPQAGFMAASAAFLFASIAILWRRGVLWAGGITIVSVLAVYAVFRLLFQVVLPTGALWT